MEDMYKPKFKISTLTLPRIAYTVLEMIGQFIFIFMFLYVFIENTKATSQTIVKGFQVLKHHSLLQNSVLSITILCSHLSTTFLKASSDVFDSSASNVSISSRHFAALHYGTGQSIFPCIWAFHPKYNALPHQDSDTLSRYLLEYK